MSVMDSSAIGSSSDAKSAQAGLWAAFDKTRLCHLIMEQIPRFAARPYIHNGTALAAALRYGIDHSLKGDFCWSLCFEPDFLRALIREGFLPICSELGGGTGLFVLLPKLHEQRCVLHFDNLHVSRRVHRRIRHGDYTLTANDSFCDVMAGCVAQHGVSWLYPPLRKALQQLADSPNGRCTETSDNPQPRMCCFALWHGGELVAGDFGAVVGSVYTSFSGFFTVSGAGCVQIVLTAKLLQAAGFAWWDMGGEHAYKLGYGATLLPRASFLVEFREQRCRPNGLDTLLASHVSERFSGAELMAIDVPCAPRR